MTRQLAEFTSLRVGGPARALRRVASTAEIAAALAELDDRGPESLLVLGGGTNVVISDEGFAGTVLLIGGGTIEVGGRRDGEVEFVVDAGVEWDRLVATSIEVGCGGLELMSGIPGRVGAAPLQNIGAYGQQVCDALAGVRVIDRVSLEAQELSPDECEFGFRTSRFKGEWRDRFVVTSVRLRLPTAEAKPPEPSRYGDVERYFELRGTSPVDLSARRQAVLDIRRGKSMILDVTDPFSRSAGSFFLTPEVPIQLARELTGRFKTMGMRVEYLEGRTKAAPDGTRSRVPAALLLQSSGLRPGDRWGPVGLSERHVLAIVTYDGATAFDVWQVANYLRRRVCDATGVTLEYEAIFVGAFPPFDLDRFLAHYPYHPSTLDEPAWLAGQRGG